jgi:16S rRNA (guanine966-N2)-methyltransferase
MRIIAGQWRSRKIDWPDNRVTRPITDRLREAVFALVGHRLGTPNALPAIHVADVFAGGGSLGLEALSRGAATACFFERDEPALRVLKRNLERLKAGAEATIVAADLWRSGVQPPAGYGPLDLVFVDPPFSEARALHSRSRMGTLLRRLASNRVTHPDAVVIFRHERRVEVPKQLGRAWQRIEQRDYNRSVVSVLVRMSSADSTDREATEPPEGASAPPGAES